MELDAGDADRLSDRLLEDGADSVTLDDAAAGSAGETPLFDEPGQPVERWPRLQLRFIAADADAGRRLLDQACAALGITPPRARIEAVPERDWVRASQSQFAPIQV